MKDFALNFWVMTLTVVLELFLIVYLDRRGACFRCHRDWNDQIPMHCTWYEFSDPDGLASRLGHPGSRGINVLCEQCWSQLTPHQRLPYYRKMFDKPWTGWEEKTWPAVKRAVLYEDLIRDDHKSWFQRIETNYILVRQL